jgi:hypothetical protein
MTWTMHHDNMEPHHTFLMPRDDVRGRYAIGNVSMLRMLDDHFTRVEDVPVARKIVYGWRLTWTNEAGTERTELVYCHSYDLDEGIIISSELGDKCGIDDILCNVSAKLYGFRRITHLVAEASVHHAATIEGLTDMLQDHIRECHPILSADSELMAFDRVSGRIVKFVIKSVFSKVGECKWGFAMDTEYSLDIRVPAGKIEVPLTIKPAPVPEPSTSPGRPLSEVAETPLTPQQLREARLRYFAKLS